MQVGFRLRAIALASAGLFVVAACGTSSGSGVTLASAQELRIRLTTEPATFDPGQAQWDYEGAVTRQTFESLLSPSVTRTVINRMARQPQPDPLALAGDKRLE